MLIGWVASTHSARRRPAVAVTAAPSGPPRSVLVDRHDAQAGTEAGVPGVSAVTRLLASLISCASAPAVGAAERLAPAPERQRQHRVGAGLRRRRQLGDDGLAQVPGLVAVRLKIVTLLPARTRQTIERMPARRSAALATRTA